MPDPKKIPLGKPLQLTDKQLDELSQISPADIEKAKAFWRNNVDKKFSTLLDAPRLEDRKNDTSRSNQ